MKRILTAAALAALATLTVAPAMAATTTTAKPAKTATATTSTKPTVLTFKQIDANHDGKISYAELKKYFPKLTKAEFAKFDTKKLGYYNHAELAAFAKVMAPKPAKTAKM